MPRVLVVEDDQMLRDVYVTILSAAGAEYEIDAAGDGRIALNRLKKNSYDLILLDLMMPDVNGVAFLKKAALTKTSPYTKVVIFSNLSSGTDIQDALDLGARTHVLKSQLTPDDLIRLVHGLCEGKTA